MAIAYHLRNRHRPDGIHSRPWYPVPLKYYIFWFFTWLPFSFPFVRGKEWCIVLRFASQFKPAAFYDLKTYWICPRLFLPVGGIFGDMEKWIGVSTLPLYTIDIVSSVSPDIDTDTAFFLKSSFVLAGVISVFFMLYTAAVSSAIHPGARLFISLIV